MDIDIRSATTQSSVKGKEATEMKLEIDPQKSFKEIQGSWSERKCVR